MRCQICRVKDAMPTSEVCEEMDCIKKYLASGRGSVSGTPYKEYAYLVNSENGIIRLSQIKGTKQSPKVSALGEFTHRLSTKSKGIRNNCAIRIICDRVSCYIHRCVLAITRRFVAIYHHFGIVSIFLRPCRIWLLHHIQNARAICHERRTAHNNRTPDVQDVRPGTNVEQNQARATDKSPSKRERGQPAEGNIMIYLFTYELSPSLLRSVSSLEQELRGFPGWCQCLRNMWLIATNEDVNTVSGKISKHLRDTDLWLLMRVSPEYKGWLPKEVWDFIEDTVSKGYS